MKKTVSIIGILCVPSLTLAGGFGGWADLAPVVKKTVAPVVSEVETTYETPVPAVRSYSYIEEERTYIPTSRYYPYFYSTYKNLNTSKTINRETTGLDVADQKQTDAQKKLMKYRSFMR